MANVKISGLPAASTLTGAELVPVVQSGVTSQTTLAAMPYVPSGTDAKTTTVQAKLRESVSVFDFMTAAQVADVQAGTASIDVTSAIQAAIDSGAAAVFFPSGKYRINTCINLTNRNTNNPIKIYGEAAPYGGNLPSTLGSSILGYTGTWMFDCTGSSFITFENLLMYGETSKGGVLHARSAAGQYAIYTRYVKVYIYIKTFPTFTSAGSIALFGDCTENQVVDQCWFEADTAYVSTLNNEVGAVSVYSTIVSSPASNTDVLHSETVYKGITGAATLMYGLASSTFEQCFWQKATVSNVYAHAIVAYSSTAGYLTGQKVNFSGQIEDYSYGFLLGGDTTNFHINVTTSAVNTAFVRLTSGTNHYGLEVNCQAYTRTANKRVLDTTTTSNANLYGGNIVVSDGGKLDCTYIKYVGTNIQMANVDTHDNAQFNYATGSTYSLLSSTTPLIATASLTAGTIANGASFGGGATCTGARLGDIVRVSANIDLQGCSLTGYVSSSNNVVAVINNNTGTSKTFASATYKFIVTQD